MRGSGRSRDGRERRLGQRKARSATSAQPKAPYVRYAHLSPCGRGAAGLLSLIQIGQSSLDRLYGRFSQFVKIVIDTKEIDILLFCKVAFGLGKLELVQGFVQFVKPRITCSKV